MAASLVGLSLPAAAQFAKPEDAIKYRQNALFVMGQHVSRVGAMAAGRAPYDAKLAADSADIIADMAKLPWAGFVPGSDKGGNTRARPEIWTEQVKFMQSSDKLIADTARLAAVARSGNLENLKTAFAATAGTCKSCHDAFRSQ
ncbi:cytochrome c [Polaromonas sp.]|uniref:c-type cytochrome n=1 Tax=Polaromonas sp. TaxID=1869339 RepID=UPI00286A0524|nr:cytochrome c [Polaromonas sp.]